MHQRRFRGGFASAAIGLAAALGAASPSVAGSFSDRYEGSVRFDRDAEILLKVERNERHVTARVRNLEYFCDGDAPGFRQDLDFRTRLASDGSFHGRRFVGPSAGAGSQVIELIDGRIKGKRASGTVFGLIDSAEPLSGEGDPDCGNFAFARWKAEAVR
jgi:hypothetical protein